MALLGHAGGGRLGNFGEVGVDQTTFGPAVFLWFVAIGGLTVVMTGGIARRSRVRPAPAPAPDPDPERRPSSRRQSRSPSPNRSRSPSRSTAAGAR